MNHILLFLIGISFLIFGIVYKEDKKIKKLLIVSGANNIICTQPFGCLPNHIAGKGMMRVIKEKNPHANIVAIDYDPGATRINQENRIKLMLSAAKRKELNKPEEQQIIEKPAKSKKKIRGFQPV